ncbi:MAG TPA: dephospho-CoA kinase [Jatrophihabitantaceae bacterium]|nr:dephospho-CoA kinase [Jatrophihabitantaceae bacterium]
MRVGLTGGLGAGKSTVSALLAEHGAVVIDADAIAREVVRGGMPGFAAVVERFGPGIVGRDGELDRARLAEIVFADDAARNDLNGIVHPLVGERSRQLMTDVPDDAIVVYDVPLLVENNGAGGFDVVVVVEADLATRLRRLETRGLPESQARARMAAQASDEQRRAVADEVLHNNGSREELAEDVNALWGRLSEREAKR